MLLRRVVLVREEEVHRARTFSGSSGFTLVAIFSRRFLQRISKYIEFVSKYIESVSKYIEYVSKYIEVLSTIR